MIAKAGKPVAKLVAFPEPKRSAGDRPKRQLGILGGTLTIPDDFDAPLPDDIIAEFEGR